MAQQTEHIVDINKMMTAVQWFFKWFNDNQEATHKQYAKAFEQAKAMEKEQIIVCWNVAHQAGRFEGKGIAEENWQTFEQYYNETYNK
jgi:hypothetical protein